MVELQIEITILNVRVQDFYKLDYLSTPTVRRRASTASSSVMSPISPRARPTSPIFKKTKLNLAFVEDPLLATAATAAANVHSIGPQNPLTPPDDDDPPEFPNKRASRQDSLIGDLETEVDGFDTMSIPDMEANRSEPQLMVHSKVYAIAEK